MNDLARFSLEVVDDIPVIIATGELDMTNVSGFEALFTRAADHNRGVVVV